MKLYDQCVLFDFFGIPMVGNESNGALIGLTPAGRDVCSRMKSADVDEAEVSAVDEMLLSCLKEGGFASPPGSAYRLQSAYLHVTQRCNLQCEGCYSFDSSRNKLSDAPLEDIKHAVRELARGGVSNLIISGGEPLLRDDLPEILAYAKEECSIRSIDVLTNGTLVTEKRILPLRGFASRVSVSFDGWSADSRAYIRGAQRYSVLAAAIKTIKDCGIPAHVIATIHSKNVDEMSNYVEMADDLGATINFSILSCPNGRTGLIPQDADLEKLAVNLIDLSRSHSVSISDSPLSATLRTKKNCGAGTTTISVAADGTAYPCQLLHFDDFKMGSLFRDAIEDVSESDTASCFRALELNEFESCQLCSSKHFCAGGCRARSYFSENTLKARDPYCALMKTFYNRIGESMIGSVAE